MNSKSSEDSEYAPDDISAVTYTNELRKRSLLPKIIGI